MKNRIDQIGKITVITDQAEMVVIKNSLTGKTFSLYLEEAQELYLQLKTIVENLSYINVD